MRIRTSAHQKGLSCDQTKRKRSLYRRSRVYLALKAVPYSYIMVTGANATNDTAVTARSRCLSCAYDRINDLRSC